MSEQKKYRLITRSDFDGLVCALLLKDLDMINEVKFVHPKDMQDGIIAVNDGDITTNLPYNKDVFLCIDHHSSETLRVEPNAKNHVIDPDAPSAARVVYKYFGGKDKFSHISDEMMDAVDKADSGQFSEEEILNPKDWVLLNFLMDSRTGLGRFKDFRVSNYQLMMDLIDYCKTHTIFEILEHPDVKERVELYFAHEDEFEKQLKRCTKVYGSITVVDLRKEETIYAGNRFYIYALYPETNISIHILWGLQKERTVFAVGKSIINRTSNTNIGKLMLMHGGGGHENAGTCQVENDQSDKILKELIAKIKSDG